MFTYSQAGKLGELEVEGQCDTLLDPDAHRRPGKLGELEVLWLEDQCDNVVTLPAGDRAMTDI
jgi:hypothetical protein